MVWNVAVANPNLVAGEERRKNWREGRNHG